MYYNICDWKEDLLEELALIGNVFMSNGHPMELCEQEVRTEDRKEYFEVLQAPYVRGFRKA